MSEESALRHAIVETMRQLELRGLNRGTSGNVSVRWGDGMLVTPSGVTPDKLTAESIVEIFRDGFSPAGALRPSSEWQMHMGIYQRRSDTQAVVHCHARHATILACAGREIPSMHYMVAVGGGASIPLAPYETFGSDALAASVVATLDGRRACLMANHGLIAIGRDLRHALAITEEIEEQAAVYWGTLAIGGPVLLGDAEMNRILTAFAGYGQKGTASASASGQGS